jgi:hypothetical protein
MTDETSLLLGPYSIENSLSLSLSREDWSTGCVDMVAPDRFFFFTDGSLMLQFFNPKYILSWRVRNIAFQKVLLTEQYLFV